MGNINPVIPNFYSGSLNGFGLKTGNKKLQKNILFTLAYYAGQNYALTSFEIWRHLFDFAKVGKSDYLNVVIELKNLRKKRIIKNHKGFWTLFVQDDNIFDRRIARQKSSVREIKKAKKWAWTAFLLPYTRGIFCFGTLGMKRAGSRSDWDILVVLEEGKIWIGRLFVSALFQFFGKRRTDKKIKSRFCLNHFLAQNGLIMQEQNEFTSKEISFSFPIAGRKQFQKYLQLNELWMKKYLPNFEKDKMIHDSSSNEDVFKKIRKLQEKVLKLFNLGIWLNKICKRLMIKKIKQNKKTYYQGADIRYSDQALVFLPRPQRKELMDKALKILTSLNSSNA